MKKIKLFLIVLIIGSFSAYGQSPGGVGTDLGLWVKADDGFTPSLWSDKSGNGYHLTQGTVGLQPVLVNPTDKFNFNPAVNFDNKAMGNNQVANRGVNNSLSLYSVASLETNSGANTLIGIGANGDNPHFGAYPNATFMMYTSLYGSADNPAITMSKPYLMSGHWQHATAGTARIELNGFAARTGGNQSSAAGNFVVGNDFVNSVNQPWRGLVPEIIVYTNPKSGNENQRISSYLGIKYGLTLRTGGVDSGTFDYLSSTSVNVWNGTANSTYHNNVFGIGRDDAGSLYQKQSKSVNDNQKLIIGAGNSLSNMNSTNTNTLNNGQFLIVGDNGLKQSLSVSLSYTSAPGGEINYRFASVWKVQNTGSPGTVIVAWPKRIANLHLIRSTNETFDTSDDFIPMTSEVTINGVVYNTATITFSSGDYFTLAGYAQAPGGVVNGLSYWYRADKEAINSGDGTDVTSWTDQTSGISSSRISTAPLPKYKVGATNYFNFNPGVNFTAIQQMIGNISVQTLSSLNYDIFTLTKEGMTGEGTSRYLNIGRNNTILDGANWDSPGLYYDGRIARRNNAGGLSYLANPGALAFDPNIPSIMYYNFTDTSLNKGMNGTSNALTATHGAIGSVTGGHIFGANGGVNPPNGDDWGFIGNIGETIIYGSGSITAAERRRVDSYLAIKYGITLERTAAEHYLASKSNIVWNGTINSAYNNNIAGIAHDIASALDQKQSISVNLGQKLIIGTTGLANTNLLNSVSLANDQYLIWGDNGLRQNLSVAISGITNINYRFESIWKVQNTNSTGTVRIAWPKGLQNLKLLQSDDETFDATDPSTDMSANTITVNGVVYNYADVTLSNGQFFTFGAFGHAPGGVVKGLNYWYRADIDAVNTGNNTDVTSWKDYASGVVSTQLGTNPLPKYVVGAANYFNFNPGINFTNAKQSLGNVNVRTVSELNYDIFTFTKEGLLPGNGNNCRIFSSLVNNANQSGNIGYWDGIGINKRFANTNDEIERVDVNYAGRYINNTGGISFSTTIPSIMYHRYNDTSVSKGLNGNMNGAIGTHHAMGYLNGGHAFGSTIFSGNGSDNDSFLGNIGETIIYGTGGNLTETERRRVDSYMAIKYGITLGRVAINPYLSSTEAIVWDGTLNTIFNNNIFGIGRDDISALHQKVSNSVNAGTILTMATNNDFISENLAVSRPTISDDQEFMIAGDNNISAVPMQSINFGNGNAKIIQRKWLLQRTGTSDDVYFQADLSTYESQFYNPNSTYMVIADDANFTVNRILVQGTKISGKWVFDHNFNTENSKRYITFATLENTVCYKPGAISTTENPALVSKVGITSLTRAGIQNADNWPAVRKGAWLVLEARTKGFVVNRMSFNASGNPVSIPPADFVEGMLVYDTTNKCLKMYTSQDNGSTFGWFCISTQTCPE
ncbi:hypothetical protein ACTJIV_04940 [Chryseobacterium sp. 22532]|uniref:hypothetical protein n=1 Tax=Chryseobacterium sp. 22532 TaxID=3453938 RepID=UPI003F86AAA9